MKKRLMMALACLLLSLGTVLAQNQIKGSVISSEDGQPVVGATIKVVGTNNGTVTDANGQFSLSVRNGAALEVSYVGMTTKRVNAASNMKITLDADHQVLDEVMVVAYGTTKRSAFTGAAAEIKSTDISAHVTSTATNALIGKVAGVQAVSSSGAPGSAPTITIRGIGSYAASSQPLYVIDGVPMEQGLATINPQDIESMSVLKDASASAIYGNRGANGVIIITTKKAKGAAQDAEVTFDAKWGANSRLVPRYDIITDPAEYYETHYRSMFNSRYYNGYSAAEAYAYADNYLFDRNQGGLGYQVFTVPEGQNLVGHNFKLNPNATLGYYDGEYYYLPDNWYDEAFHTAFRQEYNASVSGNTGKLSYFASVGYLNDGGQVENSKFERYTGRTNVEYQAKKWLKLTTNMSFTHRISQTPAISDSYGSSGSMFYTANTIGAIYPLYVRVKDENGNIIKKTENGRTIYDSNNTNQTRPAIVGNAIRDNAYNDYNSFGDVFFGQWGAEITPIEGLKLNANLSANSINSRYTYLYSRYASGSNTDGDVYVESDRTFSVNQQYLANYNKAFGLHNLGILAGYEQYKVKDQNLYGENTHLYDPFIGELNNAKGPGKDKSVGSATDNYMTEGFLGRVTYDYAERYFLNASIRRDASSKFAPGHRWGTFWSAGGAWQINKEEFMKDAKWVDLLKLKVSYGENGNDQGMGWHAYADRYTTTYNDETGEYSITMASKGNENLTWETKKSWNAGIDFSLFKYRLNGTIEFYTGKMTNLLWSKTVPLSSGLMVANYPANVGTLLNRGIEVSLDGTLVKTKDLQWDLNLSLSHNHNEFTELDESIADNGLRYSNAIVRVGGSRYQAYMIKYAGVNPENGRAQYWQALDAEGNVLTNTYGTDADGNKIVIAEERLTEDITAASRYDLGSTLPKVIGGFGTTLNAYGFDLSAQFSFQLGGKYYDGSYQALMHNGIEAGMAMHKDLRKAWTPENPDTDVPILSIAGADDPGVGSQTPYDRFLTSSNYLCLNNLSLGYTLPKSVVAPLTVKNIRVYFAGENLFLLTKRQGLDPRTGYGIGSMTSGGGMDNGRYSATRSITGGITVTF